MSDLDLTEGAELPPLEVLADLGVVVRSLAIQWAFQPFLVDDGAARERGMPGALHTPEFKLSLMSRLVEEWLGGRGYVERVRATHGRPTIIGERLTIAGRIAQVRPAPGAATAVDLELRLLGGEGDLASRGFATVILAT